ncbi:DNA sulfur modification protein DndB [Anaeromyxobacter sp. SG17]|uniref:DNA sulfur modification protein DndB n=1 Tax=Anaeromyxobacter sp. SG17 TaxID=2925405 RepID=UPI001F590CC6|nr:DNA sulfur modification protein DndB [Anaeromyxobacter sp. SG17]
MKITKTAQVELTPELLYLRGQFHLWQYRIPYYLCAVPWDFARTRFTLIDELPSSAREEWSLSELFQREIDWKRIQTELVKYLKSETQPQFFNALTIALLPREGDTFGGEYKPQKLPAMDDPNLEPVASVGGVQLQAFKDSGNSAGKLRWDAKTTVAVAVDGQHRLAAIKELGNLADAAKRDVSSVPVLFLVPDPAAGLSLPPQPKGTDPIKATLRRIFIDLNKHAKDIPQAREILLDDQDVHRVCVRRLVADRLTEKEQENRIPLGLVDWMSEDNKIDTGPFVTTVLLLEALAIEVLGKRIAHGEFDDDEEWADGIEQEIEKIQSWLTDKFDPSKKMLDALMAQVRRCFDQQVRLAWTPENLDQLADRFEALWSPHLFRIFSEIQPYRELWDFCRSKGLLKPELVNLYSAREIETGERAKKRAMEIQEEIVRKVPDWSATEDFSKPLDEIEVKYKKGRWPFFVVFQKALFRSYAELRRQYPEFVSDRGGNGPALERFTTLWIKGVNRLLATDLCLQDATFSRPAQAFWKGIGLKPDGKVDYSNAGCERLSKWLSAWIVMGALEDIPTFNELQKADDGLSLILLNLLKKTPVRRGFEDLARSQLPANASQAKIEATAREYLERRYDAFRGMLGQ